MGRRERERNQQRRAAEASAQATDDGDAAGEDSGGVPPLVTTVIPGRGLIDVGMGAALVLTTKDPDMDDDDEEEPMTDDDEDREVLGMVRDRLACEGGRAWTEISATLESLTVALDIGSGCLVRMFFWGIDGIVEPSTVTWLPGVSLAMLQRVPEGST